MAVERLQKIIAAAGIASRRKAEELITSGAVSVNGEIMTELGTKADPKVDQIKVNDKLVNALLAEKEKIYILLNKPRGYLTSVADPEGRPLVMELVPNNLGRLYPVGRLDFNTEGLLILTNDGAFTNFVTSAKNSVAKVYEAKVKGLPPEPALQRLRKGVTLDDGVKTAPAEVLRVKETENNAWLRVTLYEGRNQQIRRMFDFIGFSVVKLRRVAIGPLHDEKLPVGAFRYLSPAEVARFRKPLKVAAAPAKPAVRPPAPKGRKPSR